MKTVEATAVGIALVALAACAHGRDPQPDEGVSTDTSVSSADDGAKEPPEAGALDGVPGALEGTWRLEQTEEQETQRRRTIDAATDSINPLLKNRARSRLQERTAPPPTLSIQLDGPRVALDFGERRLELELGSAPIEFADEDDIFLMSAQLQGKGLTVVAESENGTRRTTYRPDGTDLVMDVFLTTEQLTGAVEYSSTYTKER